VKGLWTFAERRSRKMARIGTGGLEEVKGCADLPEFHADTGLTGAETYRSAIHPETELEIKCRWMERDRAQDMKRRSSPFAALRGAQDDGGESGAAGFHGMGRTSLDLKGEE
jgi:hypothetical protein